MASITKIIDNSNQTVWKISITREKTYRVYEYPNDAHLRVETWLTGRRISELTGHKIFKQICKCIADARNKEFIFAIELAAATDSLLYSEAIGGSTSREFATYYGGHIDAMAALKIFLRNNPGKLARIVEFK